MPDQTATDRPTGDQTAGDQTAVLGGGCFWCLEAVFAELRGVRRVVPGYAGGSVADPDYEQVCTGTTGHAEVVRISFDAEEISYADLLRVFFATHDPTTPDRQGPDTGTQYRSIILVADAAQQRTAEAARAEAAALWAAPIVTEIVPLDRFWEAEAYHHDYFASHPAQPYCAAVIAPKVAKFRHRFLAQLREHG